jgi:hypothetical protein
VRDAFFRFFGPVNFTGTPVPVLAARIAMITAAHPRIIGLAAGWAARTIGRVGPRRLLAHRVRPVTYVMHQFMDAADVRPAWALMRRGERRRHAGAGVRAALRAGSAGEPGPARAAAAAARARPGRRPR